MSDLHISDEAINTGWGEFRYPRPAVDEPSDAFKRGMSAAAPLIDRAARVAELRSLLAEMRSRPAAYAITADDIEARVRQLESGGAL